MTSWEDRFRCKALYGIPGGSKLASCAEAVTNDGFRIVPHEKGNLVREDRGGRKYLIVADGT